MGGAVIVIALNTTSYVTFVALQQKIEEVWLLLFMWAALSVRRPPLFCALLCLAVLKALLSGYSGGVQVAFLASVAMWLSMINYRVPFWALAGAAVAVILAAPGVVLLFGWLGIDPSPIWEGNLHFSERWAIWNLNMAAMDGHWLAGLGFGNHVTVRYFENNIYNHPHSVPILMLVDMGLVGLAVFIGFVLWVIARRSADRWRAAAEMAFLFAALFFWGQSCSTWWLASALPLFVGAGLLASTRKEG